MGTWINNVRQIRDGEPVTAGVAGRPDRANTSRTDYLKERLDAASIGNALFLPNAVVAGDVLVGQAVYWNTQNARFEKALSGCEVQASTGQLRALDSSHVVGVCFTKTSATRATLLTLGWAALDLSAAVDGEVTPGFYYLSASRAGFLVAQRPPVSVPVLFTDGTNVLVNPQIRSWAEDHIHYSVDLVARPAGRVESSGIGGSLRIVDTDADLPGWLPAEHPVFGGAAAPGARYGYNLNAHAELSNLWPPIPLESAVLLWERGQGLVELASSDGPRMTWDAHGLWWWDDCLPPWDAEYGSSSSGAVGSSSSGDCQAIAVPMRLRFFFNRMAFATDRSVVTSLEPAAGSPITVTGCTGVAAKTGALQLGFQGSFLQEDANLDGSLVIKELRGTTLRRGPVVSGLYAVDGTVTLAGTPTVIDGRDVYRGIVGIQANYESAERDLEVQVVRLEGAIQQHYEDLLYLGFPAGRSSRIRAKVKIPSPNPPASPQIRFRIQLLGRTVGTLPALTVSYRRLKRGNGLLRPLETLDTALGFSYSVTTESADQYTEVTTDAISVLPGDQIFFTIARDASDGYSGEVGILDMVAVLNSGS